MVSLKYGEVGFDAIASMSTKKGKTITMPLVILHQQSVLPHMTTPINLSESSNRQAVIQAVEARQTGLVIFTEPDEQLPQVIQAGPIYGTETAFLILEDNEEDNTLIVMAQGRHRYRITTIHLDEPHPRAEAVLEPITIDDDALVSRRYQALQKLFEHVVDLDMSFSDEVVEHILAIGNPIEGSYKLASILGLTLQEQRFLLEQEKVSDLIDRVMFNLTLYDTRIETQDQINARVQRKMAHEQRKIYLQEQLEVIQAELGDEDFFRNDLRKLQQSLNEAQLPPDVQAKAQEELTRLAQMPAMTPEATVVRTYLEWLASLPWQRHTQDNLDLANAERILNEAHFGLDKVKDRIIEHIAVRKLAKEKMKSPIICFVGPPGVGKTSLGKSIADALGREFVRVSLGGVRDEAEVRGHRRTYIGALPGRIIQTMKRAGTTNPVFMLDEIDKLSEDYRGDPASALLEVLDPEQNREFVDHYLEVPYDLSQVLFIATANELYPLPEALEDRMEIIEFRAYTEEEKVAIARQFLIAKQLEAHGLQDASITFQQDALISIIRQYTLEAGVRNLEREIANVCRKITRLVAMDKPHPHRITPTIVEKYLGPPKILPTRLNSEDRVGVVTGLVWTSGGGDIQIVEVSLSPGKGIVTMTGQLGDILQESAQTAMSYLRGRAEELNVPHEDFENNDIHLHLPEGSVPKDGPSAGITLACGIISAFTERPIRSNFAMTGEVTLRGHILPVGGVKEKVLAARRRQVQNIILPADNEKDLVEIPREALKDLRIHFVTEMQQVIDLVLLPAPEAETKPRTKQSAKKPGGTQKKDNDNKSRRKKSTDQS